MKLTSALLLPALSLLWVAPALAQSPDDDPDATEQPSDAPADDGKPDPQGDSEGDTDTSPPDAGTPDAGTPDAPPAAPAADPVPSGDVSPATQTVGPTIDASTAQVPAPPMSLEPPVEPAKPVARGGMVFEDVAGIAGLDFNPSGQYLLRFRHFEGHDFIDGGNANTFRHRARLGMGAVYDDMVGGMIQVQDVRIFGEERDTLGDFSADGFDMHQAYLRVMPVKGLETRLGRQEIAFENHRLIGTVAWIEQARSFDALRVMFKQGIVSVDSFYAKLAEYGSATKNPDGTPFHSDDKDLLAGNLHLAPIDELGIGVVVIGDFGGPGSLRRLTAGGLLGGATKFGLGYGVEGYYQHGEADADVHYRAYMAGGHLGFTFDVPTKPFIKAFGEVLSGDGDPTDDTLRSFDTLFHTGHKFYGEMDYFLNLPLHTQQRGLVDVGGSAGLSPAKPVKLAVTLHHFRAPASQADGLKVFGNELDAKLSYAPWPLFTMDLFYGFFAPGDIFNAGLADSKLEHFIYSTADFGF